MLLGHALLLLTLMADGGVRLTLTEADSARACEASRDSVVRILGSTGRPPIRALCGRTALRLTPFMHGTPPEAEVLRYRVRIPGGMPPAADAEGSGEAFDIERLDGDEPCQPAPDASPAVYCTRSAQRPLARDQE